MREEGRPQCALFARNRENLLWDGLWQAHGMRFPSLSETLPWRCLWRVHGAMWQDTKIMVRSNTITAAA